MYNTNLIRYLL